MASAPMESHEMRPDSASHLATELPTAHVISLEDQEEAPSPPVEPTTEPSHLQLPEKAEYISRQVILTSLREGIIYVTLVAAASIAAAHTMPIQLGLVLVALLPAALVLCRLQRLYRTSVLRLQMLWISLQTVITISPILIFVHIILHAITMTGMPDPLKTRSPLVTSAFQSYILAGLVDATIKYLMIRQLSRLPICVDTPAVLVYSACVGATFAAAENVMYVSYRGVPLGVPRALFTTPLHVGVAVLIGIAMSRARFLADSRQRWYTMIVVAGGIHGTYNFISQVVPSYYGTIAAAAALLLVLCGLIRYRLVRLSRDFPEEMNVHSLIEKGQIKAPTKDAVLGLLIVALIAVGITFACVHQVPEYI